MKKNNELFSLTELRQAHTGYSKETVIDHVINNARYCIKFMYTMREAAGILHISYDEIQTLVYLYRLDAIKFLSVVRIPWWSLCEYLIDPADDLDESLVSYIKNLPHKEFKVAV